MRKNPSDGLWVWLLSAAVFFTLVILYFLGGRILDRRAQSAAYRPAVLAPPAAEPAAAALPTAPVRMKIKRIEPRKYRREGSLPPPPAVR